MNCRHVLPLLTAERDRALGEREQAELRQHVADCPACRTLQRQLTEAADAWRAQDRSVEVPDRVETWAEIRARLTESRPASTRRRRGGWSMAWMGAPLAAAAAAFAVWFGVGDAPRTSPRAEYVEASDSRASTVVYVDEESGWLIVWAAAPARATSS